ncbi:MAG: hypothetical protein M1133_10615 [Armatimonadetes bacterium]|nr:hypothetical protein [Armatimonadota bacterium]
MIYFDYKTIAEQAGISDADLALIQELMQREFPHDEMMRDLHILRACMAVRDGRVTLDQVMNRRAA